MSYRFLGVILLLATGTLTACTGRPIEADHTVSPTPTLSPTRHPVLPTPPANAQQIEPIKTAAFMLVDSWSPDGQWLGYWVATEVPDNFWPFPPGMLHFFNARSGEKCTYPEYWAYDYGDHLVWQENGQVQVVLATSEAAYLGTPCGDDFSSTDYAPEIRDINSALSLDGRYEARTTSHREEGGMIRAVTTITEVATGEVKNVIEWMLLDGEGELGLGGRWLNEKYFLINFTSEGPLLVLVGLSVRNVASEYFHMPAVLNPGEEDSVIMLAYGAAIPGTNTYHLILTGWGVESAFPPVRLYHSETGETEELPFRDVWWPIFSPDGRWLLLYSGIRNYPLWVRSVDPIGSEVFPLCEGAPLDSSDALWSPDWQKVACGFYGYFSVYTFPQKIESGSWVTGGIYELYPVIWSPDGDYLAVTGNIPGLWKQALFVVPIE